MTIHKHPPPRHSFVTAIKSEACFAFVIRSSRPTAISRRAGVPIKELQPKASNRAIATAVKVDEKTVRNENKSADTSADKTKKPESIQQQGADQSAPPAPAPSPPPRVISGAAAANLVHRREVGAAERKERIMVRPRPMDWGCHVFCGASGARVLAATAALEIVRLVRGELGPDPQHCPNSNAGRFRRRFSAHAFEQRLPDDGLDRRVDLRPTERIASLGALLAGTRQAGHYPFADEGAFKLGEHPEHLEHGAPGWRAGV
jgi:hypothetical protein